MSIIKQSPFAFVFPFGKFKGQDVSSIIESDLKYCEWIINQPDLEEKHNELFSFLIKNNVDYDPDYNKKKEQNQERKKEYFTFGKYKDRKIIEVYQENPKYCEYIIELSTVIKFQNPTVQTIRDLIITNHPLIQSF